MKHKIKQEMCQDSKNKKGKLSLLRPRNIILLVIILIGLCVVAVSMNENASNFVKSSITKLSQTFTETRASGYIKRAYIASTRDVISVKDGDYATLEVHVITNDGRDLGHVGTVAYSQVSSDLGSVEIDGNKIIGKHVGTVRISATVQYNGETVTSNEITIKIQDNWEVAYRDATFFKYDPDALFEYGGSVTSTSSQGIYFTEGASTTVLGDRRFTTSDWNRWTKNVSSIRDPELPYDGLVENELDENGNIQFTVEDNGIFDENIDGGKDSYTNVGLPFVKQGNGFYKFDSNQFEAHFENGIPKSNVDLEWSDEKVKYYSDAGSAIRGFFPFNSGVNYKDAIYHFGMKIHTPFYMTENGQTSTGEDIIFEFSGDDDIWIFIDGKLVIDIGGIHNQISADINFANGEVILYKGLKENGKINKTTYLSDILGADWNSDIEKEHTLSVFYLERGKGSSNCQVYFNLPTKVQQSDVIVHHYKEGTRESVAPDEIIEGFPGDEYTTSPSSNIPANCTLLSIPDNASGIIGTERTEVIYYYSVDEGSISNNTVTKTTSLDGIDDVTQGVPYTVEANVDISNYIGRATITMVDYLPGEIIEEESDLDNGVYDESNNTITWNLTASAINTYENENPYHLTYRKNINLVYKNINKNNQSITNTVYSTVKLYTPEKSETVSNSLTIPINHTKDVHVTKVWDDNNNEDGRRPRNITLTATGNRAKYTQVINSAYATSENTWEYTFEDLPKYDSYGQEIEYVIDEENIYDDFYEKESVDQETKTITNVDKYAKVTVHYYIQEKDGTNTTTKVPSRDGGVVADAVLEGKQGETYTASAPGNVAQNYKVVSIVGAATGTYTKEDQVVTYYYRLKEPSVDATITKEGTTTIDSTTDKVSYNIVYEATINDYIGDAEIVIEDNMPYAINEGESELDGGSYDSGRESIIWNENISDINTFEDGPKTITIEKNIEVLYKDINTLQDSMTNYVSANINLPTNEFTKEVEDTADTNININGQVNIKYIDKYTDEEIATIVTKTGKVGASYDVSSDKKNISGYTLIEEPAEKTGTYTESAQEKVYYYAKNSSVHVTYIDEYTGGEIADEVTISGYQGKAYETELKTIDGYVYSRDTENTTGTMTREQIEVKYYYKKEATVLVHYYKEGTEEKVSEDVVLNGYVGEAYTTEEAEDIPPEYELVESPANKNGKYADGQTVVTYYYRVRSFEVKENTLTKVGTDEITSVNDKVTYTLNYRATISKYKGQGSLSITDRLPYAIDEDASNLNDGVYNSENKTITWTVDLGEIDTYTNGDKAINETRTIEVLYKDIDTLQNSMTNQVSARVDLPEVSGNITKDASVDTLIKIYGDVNVKYVDKYTGSEIETKVTKTDKVGADYDVSEDKKEIEGYTLIEEPEEKTGVYTEKAQEKIYYYAKNTEVHVKYVDVDTSKEIASSETISGYEKKAYTTTKKEIQYYTYQKDSGNTSGNMTREGVEVVYYYKLNDANVTDSITKDGTEEITSRNDRVNYIISYNASIDTYIGDATLTIVDTLPYDIDEASSNLAGGTYNPVDRTITWEETLESIDTLETGANVAKKITVEKDIEVLYKNVDLTQNKLTNKIKATLGLPAQEREEVVENKTDTNINVNGSVEVKYVDKYTSEEIETKVTKSGKIGTSYDVSSDKKEIEGYTLIEEPEEKTGTYTEATQEKVYYYAKNSTVNVTYIDEYTKEEIAGKEIVSGYEGKSYETEQKEINGYDFSRVEGNATGTMTREQIEVKYYYKKRATVLVHYYEENTTNKVAEDVILNGHVGESYTTKEADDIPPEYELAVNPSNKNGTYVDGQTVVTYYYRLRSFEVKENTLTKSGTDEITSVNNKVTYTINYKATVSKYKGRGTLTLTDRLPYAIDEGASNLNGGTYDETKKTVTWTVDLGDIDTYTDGDKVINETREIEVLYKDIDTLRDSMTNQISAKVDLPEVNGNITKDASKSTQINVRGSVEVKYIDKYTSEEIETKVTKTDKVGKTFEVSSDKKTIEGYTLIEEPTEKTGTYTEATQEKVYYYAKNTEVHVKYVDVDTGEEIASSETISGYEKKAYTTTKKEIQYYTYQKDSGNTSGNMARDGVEVVYYYKLNDSSVTDIITKDGTTDIDSRKDKVSYHIDFNASIETYIGKASLKIVDTLPYAIEEEASNIAEGTYDEASRTITWNIDLGDIDTLETGTNIPEKISIEKDIEVLYKNVDLTQSKLTNRVQSTLSLPNQSKEESAEDTADTNINVNGNVIVKYVDKYTSEEIETKVTKTGKVGTSYDVSSDKKEIEGYTLVEEPAEKTGTYTESVQEKVYYYAKNSTVHVTYIDEYTGGEIADDVTIEGYQGKAYSTELKTIGGYVYSRDIGNTTGTMTREQIEVKYYYKKQATVLVHYYKEGTEEKVSEDVVLNGYVGEAYTTEEAEDIPPEYELVADPANKNGKYADGQTVVTYYYRIRSFEVKENTLSKTGSAEITSESEKVTYTINYNATVSKYKGEGTLTITDTLPYEIDEGASSLDGGTYNKSKKTITWTVDLGEIDTYTNGDKVINETREIEVLYKDIDTLQNSMTNQVSARVDLPEVSGNITKDASVDTLIKIYGDVNVKYVDKYTGSEIETKVTKTDKVGADYDVSEDKKEIEGYTLIEEPEEKTGVYTEKAQEKIYYYAKNTEVHVKYVDVDTSKEIASSETISGYEKKAYTTTKKEIQYYTYQKDSGNTSGNMTREGVEVVYYYKLNDANITDSITKDGTEEITSRNDKVNYIISYNASIDTYIGDATLTVVDKLPYAIEEEQSILDEGIYNPVDKTITWNINLGHIDTLETGENVPKQITIEKDIEVLYKDIDVTDDILTNKVTGKLYLEAQEKETTAEDTANTNINVNGNVDVKYIDKYTSEEIETKVTKTGKVGTAYDVSSDKKEIEGYTLIEEPAEKTGTYTEATQEKVYYYAKNSSVHVTYIDEYTNDEIETEETITGYEGKSYRTEQKEIDGYDFSRVEGNATGTMTREQIEVKYYYKKKATVLVHYYEENTTNKVAEDVILNGHVGESYITTESEDIPPEYELVANPDNKNGTYVDGQTVVTYYYRVRSFEVKENTLTKSGTDEITSVNNKVTYTINYKATVSKYKGKGTLTLTDRLPYAIDEGASNLNGGTYDETKKTVTWTVDLGDIDTYTDGDKVINETREIEVLYKDIDTLKDSMTNQISAKVDLPEVNGNITKDASKSTQINVRGSVEVKYIDKYTSEEIETKVTKTDKVGKTYDVSSDKKVIEGYTLIGEPSEKTGTYTEATQEKVYLYAKNTEVHVKYVDIDTSKEIATDETISGYEKKAYTTTKKNIENYTYQKDSGNTSGNMTREGIEVVYYYKLNDSSVTDMITKEGTTDIDSRDDKVSYQISYAATIETYIGKASLEIVDNIPYEIDEEKSNLDGGTYDKTSKTITWNIDLGDIDTLKTGENVAEQVSIDKNIEVLYKDIDVVQNNMTNNITATLNLPAQDKNVEATDDHITDINVNGNVEVKYVDKYTKEEIDKKVTKTGKVGTSYDVSSDKKEISGYTLIEEPTEKTGTYTESVQEKVYYYAKNSTVRVTYIDEYTNDEIEVAETIEGYEGKQYTAEQKIIDGYAYSRDTGNTSGTMTREQIEVKYYYKKEATVLVHYYKEGTNEKLSEDVILNGYVGENYTTKEADDIPPEYELVADPVNKNGTYVDGQTVVTYYYRVRSFEVAENTLSKEGTNEIDSVKDKVTYTIHYKATIGEYKGEATLSIVDKLPYKIDEEASDLSAGVYDEENKTITWTVNLGDIDTYTNGNKVVDETRTIEVLYKNIDTLENSMTNQVSTRIDLPAVGGNITKDASKDTLINVYGDVNVKYVDKYTSEEIETKVTKTGKVGTTYDVSEDKKEIEGYTLIEEPSIKAGIYTENTQEKVYYYAKNSLVNVKYLDKVTKDEIATAETINGYENLPYDTVKKEIENFTYVEDSKNTQGTMTRENIEVIYYYLQNTSVRVEHIDKNTNDILDTETIKGLEGDECETSAKDFEGYILVEEPEEKTVIMTKDEIVVRYYYSHVSAGVIEKHIVEETGKVLYQELHEGKEGDEYTTTERDFEGYRLITSKYPSNATGHMGKDLTEVVYYYEIEDVQVTENSVSKEGTTSIDERTDKVSYNLVYEGVIDTYRGEVVVYLEDTLPYKIDVDESNLDGGTYDEDTNTIKWYENIGEIDTLKTGENIPEQIRVEKNIEVLYKDIDVYQDNMVNEIKGVLYLPAQNEQVEAEDDHTTDIEVDGDLIVKYVDKYTNEEIETKVTKSGRVGTEFDVSGDKKEVDGYTLIEEPAVKTGTYTEETQEKIYYYAKNTSVHVTYVDKATNEEIAEDELIKGYEKQKYNTEKKVIEGYTYVEDTGNTTGEMTREKIEVVYYYLYNTRVIVEHIDEYTNELLATETEEGLVGDIYESSAKDFEGYVLVREPEEKTVTMTREEIVLRYYYSYVSGGVIEKHIDEITGEVLDEETYEGKEGDPYSTSEKEFNGYDLVEEKYPANSEGTMTRNVIEVKYYYIKRASVRVQYIDEITGEKLTEDVIINGHENDPYTTEEKEFEGYDLVEIPENATGEMKITVNEDGTYDTEILVQYYYKYISAGVIEKHIDEITGEVLAEESYSGYEGDPYETKEKEFTGYDLVKEKYPDNATGKMTRELIEVDYYYIKKANIRVEYVDKLSGEKLTEDVIIDGHENDPYTTEQKEFEGYDFIEVVGETEGTMTSGEEKVITYYYLRPATVITRYLEEETEEVLAEEETTLGHEGDEYITSAKEIEFYKISKLPENATGTMKDTIYVTYYYKRKTVDFSIDKKIGRIEIDGKKQRITNEELGKAEVYRKSINSTEIRVEYEIEVRNEGEIAGNVTILEKIPEYLSMKKADNPGWEITGNEARYETEEIGVGESKTYKVVMEWKKGDGHFGMQTNIAKIETVETPSGFEEENLQNNADEAEVMITISTGVEKVSGIVLIALIYIAAIIYMNRKLTIRKENK